MDFSYGNTRVAASEEVGDLYGSGDRIKNSDNPALGIVLPEGIYDLDTLCQSSSSLPAIEIGWQEDESEWMGNHSGLGICRGGSFNCLYSYSQFFPQQRNDRGSRSG